MKMFLGIALVAIALAIAMVPAFTDCQSQGKSITLANGKTIDMKCHWSAQAEIAIGAPLLVVGAVLPFMRKKGGFFALSLVAAVLGAAAIAVPNGLIGVCATDMLCNNVMQPTLTVLGGLAIVGGLGGMVMSRKADA